MESYLGTVTYIVLNAGQLTALTHTHNVTRQRLASQAAVVFSTNVRTRVKSRQKEREREREKSNGRNTIHTTRMCSDSECDTIRRCRRRSRRHWVSNASNDVNYCQLHNFGVRYRVPNARI